MELKNKEVSQQQQRPQHIQLGITRLAIVKHTTLLHKIWYLVSLTIWNYKMLYTHTHTHTHTMHFIFYQQMLNWLFGHYMTSTTLNYINNQNTYLYMNTNRKPH